MTKVIQADMAEPGIDSQSHSLTTRSSFHSYTGISRIDFSNVNVSCFKYYHCICSLCFNLYQLISKHRFWALFVVGKKTAFYTHQSYSKSSWDFFLLFCPSFIPASTDHTITSFKTRQAVLQHDIQDLWKEEKAQMMVTECFKIHASKIDSPAQLQ